MDEQKLTILKELIKSQTEEITPDNYQHYHQVLEEYRAIGPDQFGNITQQQAEGLVERLERHEEQKKLADPSTGQQPDPFW